MGKKIKITLLSIGIVLVASLGLGVVVYDQATDYLIANVFESLLREDLAREGMLGEDGELTEAAVTQLASQNQDQTQAAGTTQAEAAQPAQPDSADQPAGEAQQDQPAGEAQQDQQPETSQQESLTTTAKKTLGSNKDTNTTSAKPSQSIEARVKEIVKGIPIKDKNAVMRLVMQNVSSNDIRYLSGLVTDGHVSGADIAKAKEVALRSFSADQLESVKYYYYKYIGLFSEFF